MQIRVCLDNFIKQRKGDHHPDVRAFIKYLNTNAGSFIVTDDDIFHVLIYMGWQSDLLKALHKAKGATSGPSPVIHAMLENMKALQDKISNELDLTDFHSIMADNIEYIETRDFRVSDASMEFAEKHFFQYPAFINTLKLNHVEYIN